MIYFLRRANGDIKIGTTKSYNSRIAKLAYQYGSLEMLGLIEGSYKEEHQLHEKFAGIWTGDAEWFSGTPELLAFIASQDHLTAPVRQAQTDENIEFQRELRQIRKGRNRAAARTTRTDLTAPLHIKVSQDMKRQVTEYARAMNISEQEAVIRGFEWFFEKEQA